MNLSETLSRCKTTLASATLALTMVSGSAQALTDGDLVFIAFDAERNGNPASIAIDLNLNALANVGDFSAASIMSTELQAWLNDANAGPISWGVFAVGDDLSPMIEDIRYFSTVNPAAAPPPTQSQGNVFGAFGVMDNLVTRFANADGDDDGIVEGIAGTNEFLADQFLPNFGNQLTVMSTGGTDETLTMFAIGLDPITAEGIDPEAVGFWSLDATTGGIDFAVVPVPAAVWMFGSALLGLLGARRRNAA
ncbi:MAG: hypothetical protein AAF387_18730 [Pseudomonadota bacterium]